MHLVRTSVLGTVLKAWKPKWRPMRCTTCMQRKTRRARALCPGDRTKERKAGAQGSLWAGPTQTATMLAALRVPAPCPDQDTQDTHHVDGCLKPRRVGRRPKQSELAHDRVTGICATATKLVRRHGEPDLAFDLCQSILVWSIVLRCGGKLHV